MTDRFASKAKDPPTMMTFRRLCLWWLLLAIIAAVSNSSHAVANGSCAEDGTCETTDLQDNEGAPPNASQDIDLGVPQNTDNERTEQVKALIEAAKDYIYNKIANDPKKRHLLDSCKLRYKDCAYWAVKGCESDFMKTKCAPVCGTCEKIPIEDRCPLDIEKMPNVWKPGDLNQFFVNLTTREEYKQYEPNVLSCPDYLPGDSEETADYLVGGPWVVVLENVVTQEEAETLIELGAIEGYKHSVEMTAAGRRKSTTRTSQNSWCKGSCHEDPVAQRIDQRIANITGIPEANFEYLCVYILLGLLPHCRGWRLTPFLSSLGKCSGTRRDSSITRTLTTFTR